MTIVAERKKIGLALGSGAVWGFAHIGVLKVLEENNIPIDMIAGTSIGAFIGALYAAEPNAKKLAQSVLATKWKKLYDYTLSHTGFIKGIAVETFIKEKLSSLTFADLKIPLFVVATDLEKRQEIIFNKGSISKAVHASITIPGIFVPQENNGRILVDGGIINPLPVSVLREAGADIVIAVNVLPLEKRKPIYEGAVDDRRREHKIPHVAHVISKSFEIMAMDVCRDIIEYHSIDLLISPSVAKKISWTDFSHIQDAVDIGYREAKKSIKGLRKIVEPHPFKDFLLALSQDIKEVKKEVKEELKEGIKNLGNSQKPL